MAGGAFVPDPVLRPDTVYDSLDEHIAQAPDIGKAAIPMGMLLAWCVRMGIVSQAFEEAHERSILRLRMEEIAGSELLVAAGGDLTSAMFSPRGCVFMQDHYADYPDLFRQTFAVNGGAMYEVKESWDNYAELAKHLTPLLLESAPQNQGLGLFTRLRKLFWH